MSAYEDTLSPEERAAISHWADYGQKGQTPLRRVMSRQYRADDFLTVPESVPWEVPLHPHQLPILLFGFCPSESRSQLGADAFIVGNTVRTHGFTSTSANPNMSASEDKWFVYARGPDAEGNASLHMHRSWSGKKMVELTIDCGKISSEQQVESPSKITSIKWESGPDHVMTADKAKEIVREVCSWVLNVDIASNERC